MNQMIRVIESQMGACVCVCVAHQRTVGGESHRQLDKEAKQLGRLLLFVPLPSVPPQIKNVCVQQSVAMEASRCVTPSQLTVLIFGLV